MNCIFEQYTDAIDNAFNNHSFGICYTEQFDADSDIHLHECCEVLFCLSGIKNVLIDGHLYDVRDHDIFVINQYEAHKIIRHIERECRCCIMQISPAFIKQVTTANTDLSVCFNCRDLEHTHRICLGESILNRLKEYLNMLAQKTGYGDDIIKNNIMTSILVELNRAYLKPIKTGRPSLVNQAVVRAMEYINENLTEELLLDTVANSVCLSVNQICRLFSKYCGTTIWKYITTQRVARAKKLLASGESVTKTGTICGFGDYSGFIRTFKKTVGVTPGKYQNQVCMMQNR